jgi:hypothetical protein
MESFISTRRKASFHPEMDDGRMDDGMTGQDGWRMDGWKPSFHPDGKLFFIPTSYKRNLNFLIPFDESLFSMECHEHNSARVDTCMRRFGSLIFFEECWRFFVGWFTLVFQSALDSDRGYYLSSSEFCIWKGTQEPTRTEALQLNLWWCLWDVHDDDNLLM